ncbi:MAG TPA: flagellar protein FlgN [Nitrospira sp.]|nr:flagellar protein FlgN [Nitrospira sp.]MCW5795854.1 flagellar protein FlgN [Nitrospira sp.]HMU28480.1 flagellar protein FlgN [Nitrospira sp.]HMV55850.1 flagellar protein FlgN [Nitrospira sp.]HMW85950.1 flagellar protein FlgN [Nitrospira sp.]
MSTLSQTTPTESDMLVRGMLDKMLAFQSLLLEEQDAIRSLSFGQFTSVTTRKSQLLDEIRDFEQRRRQQTSSELSRQDARTTMEAKLLAAIGETDRLNRFNAALIGQSLEFLQGALKRWQRAPESAALYSSAGTAVPAGAGLVRAKG